MSGERRPRRGEPGWRGGLILHSVRGDERTVDGRDLTAPAPPAPEDAIFDSLQALARGLYWLARGSHDEARAVGLARVGVLLFADFTQAEIAAMLGITTRTVRNRECELRALLRASDRALPLPRPVPDDVDRELLAGVGEVTS